MSISPKDLISGSTRTSSLPEIFIMIHEVINDPQSSYSDIAKVINLDTSLSARLLKIVNSAFYSFPSSIETVTRAVSIIGTEQLYDLALATTIMTTFKGVPDRLINMNSFWRHNLGVGIVARNLAIHCRESNAERYYLAGILHDVGRLIILENLPEQAHEIFALYNDQQGVMHDIEKKILGFDHTEVGAALARSWGLPLSLEEIIGCHHAPSTAGRYPVEAGIIHLADIIAKAMELGSSGDTHVPPVEEKGLESIELPRGILPSMWEQVIPQYEENVEIVLSR